MLNLRRVALATALVAGFAAIGGARAGTVLTKGRYQNRARNVVVLLRLDFGGAPPRNPDGSELPCPHLHI